MHVTKLIHSIIYNISGTLWNTGSNYSENFIFKYHLVNLALITCVPEDGGVYQCLELKWTDCFGLVFDLVPPCKVSLWSLFLEGISRLGMNIGESSQTCGTETLLKLPCSSLKCEHSCLILCFVV